jgi:hypothetical protein
VYRRNGRPITLAADHATVEPGSESRDPRRNRSCPSTSDRLYDADEAEFLLAVERHKAPTGDRFPTYSDLLGVLKSLGYRKTGSDSDK